MPQIGPWTTSAENAQRIADALISEFTNGDGESFSEYMDRWFRWTVKHKVHRYEQRAASNAVTPDDGVIDA